MVALLHELCAFMYLCISREFNVLLENVEYLLVKSEPLQRELLDFTERD